MHVSTRSGPGITWWRIPTQSGADYLQEARTPHRGPYGKHPEEVAQVLEYVRTVEPLLRRTASAEIDTSGSPEQVIETILSIVLPGDKVGGWSGAGDRQDSPEN